MKVPLRLESREAGPRTGEPVTFGLPWPKGAVHKDEYFHLVTAEGNSHPLQTEVTSRWADGSIRWCLFDAFLSRDEHLSYAIEIRGEPRTETKTTLSTVSLHGEITVNTGASSWAFITGDDFLCDVLRVELREYGPDSLPLPIENTAVKVLTAGPLRTTVEVNAIVPLEPVLRVRAVVDLYAGLGTAKVRLTLTNTAAADHPGGNWDLGAGGSYHPEQFVVKLAAKPGQTVLSAERSHAPELVANDTFVYQDSSGGDNWQSTNHINAQREIPHEFRGYKRVQGKELDFGLHATPILTRQSADEFRGLAMPEFWENFPKAMVAASDVLTLELFPKRGKHRHELQGGEQKTFTFFASVASDNITATPLQWCRSPLRVTASPEWYCASGVIPELTPRATDPNAKYLALIDLAIHGEDTFLTKREKIDEYGWRHYGDVYGDHEAVYHKGETPMISHYNNQYDCILAFIQQWMRDGQSTWLDQGISCADHTVDIDRYHTQDDKSAYNGGLFWHTYHYADADTGNHRSYPKKLKQGGHFDAGQDLSKMGETGAKLQKVYAVGGGPAGSHNYSAGLMLAYYITGEVRYKDAALGLADFVISIDDPRGTKFKYLSREYTGLASESSHEYHGPGRAGGNSILALLVGYELTDDKKYLDKCEQIIRRVVHPMQNLERLDLLNAELRWFYTMTLQALGVYLDMKAERSDLGRMYNYARLTLLHYARWMAERERPILDHPEKLQYPTETWAAQDLRKVEVFQFAAKHADGAERDKFLERAAWFYEQSIDKLFTFDTKTLCRPQILAMRYGWSRAAWQADATRRAPAPTVPMKPEVFGAWSMFVTQKQKAIRRAKLVIALTGIAVICGIVALAAWLLLRS